MVHVSLKRLEGSVLDQMMVGVLCKRAWRIFLAMDVEKRVSRILIDNLACLLAGRRPYIAVLNVGRVMLNE